jgi:hypothetical protein
MDGVPKLPPPASVETQDEDKPWEPSDNLRYLAYVARMKTILVRTAGAVRNVRHAAVRMFITLKRKK